MNRSFQQAQIPVAAMVFTEAEKLVKSQFRLADEDWRRHKYDVKTLAFLEPHEVKDGAFAHLCKYGYEVPVTRAGETGEAFDFYRICLQDHSILDAVDRASSFIKFESLMLYIAVHELIHVMRFGSGVADFDAPLEEKEQEEKIVHSLTHTTLQPVKHKEMDRVLECFSSRFVIGDYTS